MTSLQQSTTLEIHADFAGGLHAGFFAWPNVFHTIVRGAPGAILDPEAHWAAPGCKVCDDRGFTFQDFERQWSTAFDRFAQGGFR